MGSVEIRVIYRPIRIGFLVRDGQVEDVVAASKLAILFWGGIYNPIIPVSQDVSPADHLIKLFRVDVLYPVGRSQEIEELTRRHSNLRQPMSVSPTLFYEDWATKREDPCYLDVLHIIDYYWEREFKRADSSNCVLPKWDPTDELAKLFTLMFGQYARDELNLKHDYENDFVRGLRSAIEHIPKDAPISELPAIAVTPAILTTDRLVSYGGGLDREDGVFIGKASEFEDLVSFWNLRASGKELVFFDPDLDGRMRPFVQKALVRLDERPNRHPNIEEWIGAYYRISENQVKGVLDSFNFKKMFCLYKMRGFHHQHTLPHFEPQGAPGTYEAKYERTVLSFSLPQKPLGTLKANDTQALVASIDTTIEFEDSSRTLQLPYLPDLNEFYSRALYLVDPNSIRVEHEGVGVIIRGSTDAISLCPITVEDLMLKVFERSEMSCDFSHAGRLAKQIVRRMGHLESCRVFKIRGVRRLLHASMNREITGAEAKRIIWEDSFGLFQDLYIEPRTGQRLTNDEVWSYLLKKRAFHPRLRKPWIWIPRSIYPKRKFECPACGLKAQITERDFQSDWQCPFCDVRQCMPIYIDRELPTTIDRWRFSRSALFAVSGSQEGSLPVILTIMQLSRVLDHVHRNCKWITSLRVTGPCLGNGYEIDFAYLTLGTRYGEQNLQVAVGECKGDAGSVEDEDIEHLVAVKELLDKKGIRAFLVFSKTGPGFTEDEVERFKSLLSKGIKPILFTRSELEPYHPYGEAQRSRAIPHPYAMNLEEMAENSEWLYLRA